MYSTKVIFLTLKKIDRIFSFNEGRDFLVSLFDYVEVFISNVEYRKFTLSDRPQLRYF